MSWPSTSESSLTSLHKLLCSCYSSCELDLTPSCHDIHGTCLAVSVKQQPRVTIKICEMRSMNPKESPCKIIESVESMAPYLLLDSHMYVLMGSDSVNLC